MDLALSPPPDDASILTALADPRRLAAVQRTGLLDSPPEENFDRLTRLASRLTGAPVVFVSLLDQGRDYHKSLVSPIAEVPGSSRVRMGRTFCHYVAVTKVPLVIEDATLLPVFRDVPSVKAMGVRAYAGVPLLTEEGDTLGTFCAIDFVPRHWTEQDLDVLTEFAHSALREIRLRMALQHADAVNQQLVEQIQRVDELNMKLEELATTDPLTGLRNRRAFDSHLEQELAIVQRRGTPLSLLMLDVDHFKRVNDTLGHDGGDRVLQAIAGHLKACARTVDVVARVGGEEFAVILPSTGEAGAHEVGERMRQAVENGPWDEMPVTISVGVATLVDGEDAERIYGRADAALYAAKQAGRNRVQQA
ncbi:sensor domain-containing diguanylate cyclase [Acidovorax sp. Root217]|uniref:sensor domain-containing diguanylate cyclase n=1 Tax=Acidovorax sp. Root217 TaxID=1736492 RepID=UPI00070E542E|nr:sensor domain-containing diguanylate cyclase [Acidovorax sp. Root217]KRC17599.1 diguanylate cyclase [Acidovorax sp. Root217]